MPYDWLSKATASLEAGQEDASIDLDTARAIAMTLVDQAIWLDEVCAFTGATAPETPGRMAVYRALKGDYYEGSTGIARFLGSLAAITGEDIFRHTALGALRHAQRRCQGWSLYSGRLGFGLVALELAPGLDAPELWAAGLQAITESAQMAIAATSPPEHPGLIWDLISGAAGVLWGLTEAIDYDPEGTWATAAVTLGQNLVAGAIVTETGWAWPLSREFPQLLCGLAHGASGIALALTRLMVQAPDQGPWAEAATAARAFERQWYSTTYGSWADLRQGDPDHQGDRPDAYPYFWCHGCVGIAQERLAAIAAQQADDLCRADALAALAGTIHFAEQVLAGPAGPAAGDLANGSLCHGLGGIVDLLIAAWRIDPAPDYIHLARQITAFMRNDAGSDQKWRSGVIGGSYTPGLMLGSAGMGWAHLRAWNPKAIPAGWAVSLRPQA